MNAKEYANQLVQDTIENAGLSAEDFSTDEGFEKIETYLEQRRTNDEEFPAEVGDEEFGVLVQKIFNLVEPQFTSEEGTVYNQELSEDYIYDELDYLASEIVGEENIDLINNIYDENYRKDYVKIINNRFNGKVDGRDYVDELWMKIENWNDIYSDN